MSDKRNCISPYSKPPHDKIIISNDDEVVVHNDSSGRVCLLVNYSIESSDTIPIDIELMTGKDNNTEEGE